MGIVVTCVAPDAYDWTEENCDAALDWLTTVWTTRCNEAAQREGWGIWDCSGSENAPFQICKIDSPDDIEGIEVPTLQEDADAWEIVLKGTGEHHQLAREFVTIFVPNTEGKFMEKHWRNYVA